MAKVITKSALLHGRILSIRLSDDALASDANPLLGLQNIARLPKDEHVSSQIDCRHERLISSSTASRMRDFAETLDETSHRVVLLTKQVFGTLIFARRMS